MEKWPRLLKEHRACRLQRVGAEERAPCSGGETKDVKVVRKAAEDDPRLEDIQ